MATLYFGVRICYLLRTPRKMGDFLLLYINNENPPHGNALFNYPASTICAAQSRQPMLTFLVARTELPQQGQIYFLVELVFEITGGGAGKCVPVPVTL